MGWVGGFKAKKLSVRGVWIFSEIKEKYSCKKENKLTCNITHITHIYNHFYLNIVSGMSPVSFGVQISQFKLEMKQQINVTKLPLINVD